MANGVRSGGTAIRTPLAGLSGVVALWLVASADDFYWNVPAVTLPAMAAAGAVVGLAGARSRRV
jgi:hypothetical protein